MAISSIVAVTVPVAAVQPLTSLDQVAFNANAIANVAADGAGLHLVGGNATTPPTVAAGTGAGTSPTVGVVAGSSDTAGVLSILTGSTPAGTNATIATITFGTAFANTPKAILLTPGNSVTGALAAALICTPTAPGKTTWTLISGATNLVAATTYLWNYLVLG